MSGQFAAKAPMIGYLYQIWYALFLLFKAGFEDTSKELSIETLDDVSFENNGTALELIQTKHHINAVDLTDSSSELWKTLRIWCEHQKANPGTRAILTLVTTGIAAPGSVCEMLRVGGSRNIPVARQQPVSVAQAKSNKLLKEAYKAFNALTQSDQDALLTRITVVDQSHHIQDLPLEIKRYLSYSVAPQHVDDLFEHLQGWWGQQAVEMLRAPAHLPLLISAGALRNKVITLSRAYSETSLPDHFPRMLEIEESSLKTNERVFVAQLRLVLDNDSRLRYAIEQYFRAYNQRSKWLELGLIDDDELDLYADQLVEEWTLEFHRMQAELGDLPDADAMKRLGLQLFNWADRKTWTPIRRDYRNAAFPRGSLHILANAQRVGWHPDFKNELARIMAKAVGAAS